MDAKVALITGANKGIGLEIARQLGRQGIKVILGIRNFERGQAAVASLVSEGIDAFFMQLDVTNEAHIKEMAQKIEQMFGKLDILVNNAGIAIDKPFIMALDLNLMRQTFETNFFAAAVIIKELLPLLQKAPAARIVNMSSGLGSITFTGDPNFPLAGYKLIAYNASKTALNALTAMVAFELRDTAIKVNAADPGYVATDMTANTGPRTVQEGAAIAVHLANLGSDGPTGGFFNDNGLIPW
jgi:NAD(P)-dependent dehydrogenase (short-subunit alcohol dehydrogenase family)